MKKQLRALIIREAKRDAKLFVSEFQEPLDPAATDWDGAAWSDTKASNLTRAKAAWELYQRTLVTETQRLCQ